MTVSLDPKMLIVNRKGVFLRASEEPTEVTQLSTRCQRTDLVVSARAHRPDVALVDLALGSSRALRIGFALKEELPKALVLVSDQSRPESVYYRLEGNLQSGFVSTYPAGDALHPLEVQRSRRHLVSVS